MYDYNDNNSNIGNFVINTMNTCIIMLQLQVK